MHHGTLLSFAILALLAASPAAATPTGVSARPPARVEAPRAPAAHAALPSTRESRREVRLYRVAMEGAEDEPAQSAAAPADGGQALDPVPTKPMIIAVAGGGAAGYPSPLVITVVPAPYPPARVVAVLISGLPPGSVLSRGEDRGAGIWRVGLKNSGGVWSAGLKYRDNLSLTVPPDYIGTVDLKLTALAMHDNNRMVSNTQALSVTFDPPPTAYAALAETDPPMPLDEPAATVAVEEPAHPATPKPSTDAEPEGPIPAVPAPLLVEAPPIETVVPPNPAETERADAPVAEASEIPLVQSAAPPTVEAMEPEAEQEASLVDEPNAGDAESTAPATPPVPSVETSDQEERPVAEPAPAADSAEGIAAAPPVEASTSAPSAPKRTQTAALGDVAAPAPAPSRPEKPAVANAMPSAAPAPASSAATLPEDLVMRRGDALFAQGDLAGARLFYEFGLGTGSGSTGSGRAAFALGKTYDPLVHRQLGVRGVPSDPAKAADWYRTAIAAGNTEAERWLQDLTAWLDHGR